MLGTPYKTSDDSLPALDKPLCVVTCISLCGKVDIESPAQPQYLAVQAPFRLSMHYILCSLLLMVYL